MMYSSPAIPCESTESIVSARNCPWLYDGVTTVRVGVMVASGALAGDERPRVRTFALRALPRIPVESRLVGEVVVDADDLAAGGAQAGLDLLPLHVVVGPDVQVALGHPARIPP